MLAKSLIAATAAFALLSACSISRRWEGSTPNELNIAFQLDRGVPIVRGTIDNRPARLIISTGRERSAVDRGFSSESRVRLGLGGRMSASIATDIVDLQGLADGVIGADFLRSETVTLDYERRLMILSSERLRGGSRFRGPLPNVMLRVDSKPIATVVDSAFPESLIVPASSRRRRTVHVAFGEISLGSIEAAQRPITVAVAGSGLLSRFTTTIDYPSKKILIEPR
jgi:hypothetical protein